jgi:hypothetical protein
LKFGIFFCLRLLRPADVTVLKTDQ